MGHTRRTEQEPEKQLWEQLDKVRAGMLGIEGSHSHMQPMAHQADKDGHAKLWFFTSRSSDLFREMGDGRHAHFCLVGKDQDYHACLMGELSESRDRSKIDAYWNDHVAAWWTSKNDPGIALLEFDLLDAAIWASRKTRSAMPGKSRAQRVRRRSPIWAPARISTSRNPRARRAAKTAASGTDRESYARPSRPMA